MNTAPQSSGFRAMSRPQKTAVIVLVFFGVGIFGFWAWQFEAQLSRPFTYNGPKSASVAATTATDLHKIDTDGDGISDYDEINVYHTSPYLEDSDSDGIPDLKEIQQGTDPNCPQGQTCTGATQVASSSPATTEASVNPASTTEAVLNGNTSDITSTSTLENMMTGQLDAATLRQILIQNGADKTALDKISDQDLMDKYQQTLESQNTSTNQ